MIVRWPVLAISSVWLVLLIVIALAAVAVLAISRSEPEVVADRQGQAAARCPPESSVPPLAVIVPLPLPVMLPAVTVPKPVSVELPVTWASVRRMLPAVMLPFAMVIAASLLLCAGLRVILSLPALLSTVSAKCPDCYCDSDGI